jgi:Rrf2 family transcriptional regulator, iron-sulfur cluster assembly transcription factor
MKITANEEYGLRVILSLANLQEEKKQDLVSLKEIAEREGLTTDYAASILMKLRESGLVISIRGKYGGYKLVKDYRLISVFEVLKGLAEEAYTKDFCETHSGNREICIHKGHCNISPIWTSLGYIYEKILERISLADLKDNKKLQKKIKDHLDKLETSLINWKDDVEIKA